MKTLENIKNEQRWQEKKGQRQLKIPISRLLFDHWVTPDSLDPVRLVYNCLRFEGLVSNKNMQAPTKTATGGVCYIVPCTGSKQAVFVMWTCGVMYGWVITHAKPLPGLNACRSSENAASPFKNWAATTITKMNTTRYRYRPRHLV